MQFRSAAIPAIILLFASHYADAQTLGSPALNAPTFSNAPQTRTNLGLDTLSTQNAGAVAITGGTISGTNASGANVTATGGTTSRTLANRAGDTVNVLNFGGDATGTSDNFAAFNAAAATVTSGANLAIFVPRGTYLMNTPFTGNGRIVTLILDVGVTFTGSANPSYFVQRSETLNGGQKKVLLNLTSNTSSGSEANQLNVVESGSLAPPAQVIIRINNAPGSSGVPINDVGESQIYRWDGGASASSVNVSSGWRASLFPTVAGSGSVMEWNPFNRHQDAGWNAATGSDWWGGLLIVPEVDTVSGGPLLGFPVAFSFATVRSSHTSNLGYRPQTYNAFISYADSIAPNGRGVYMGGDSSGTVANYPYSPFQAANNWLHGLTLNTATFNDNVAIMLGSGQAVGFTDGTGTAKLSGTGSAGNDGINIITTGTGQATVNGNVIATGQNNVLYCDQYASPQACHDALPSTGGKMMMPSNTTYNMTSRLLISKPNVTVECPNWTTVFKRGQAPQQIVSLTGDGDVIRDCTIDGNGATFLTLNVSDLQISGANSLVWHVQAINAGGNISVAASGVNSRIAYSTITGLSSNNNIYGIWAINHVTVTIDHNTISGSGIDGIGFDGEGSIVANNHLFNNHCYSGIQGGQLAQYGTSTITHNEMIIGNTIDQGCGQMSAGIELGGGNDTTVSGNAVYNQYGNGMIVDPQVNGALITGNTIANSGQSGSGAYGIAVYGNASHVKISGNRIIDNQSTPTQVNGVYIFGGTTDYVYVTDNDFTGTPIPITNVTSPGLNVQINGNVGIGFTGGIAATNDNRVRNPCFVIDQVKEGGTYSQTGGNSFIMDGWVSTTSSSAFSAVRSTATPATGCGTNLHLIQVNQRATPASTEFYLIRQAIMGSDMQDLNWGTPLAKPVMVDFCAKSSVAGTFPFVLSLTAINVWYATTYTLAANTLSCQTFQLPAQKSQTLANTNVAALYLQWDMGSGSNQLTSATNAWASGLTTTGVVGETSFVAQTAGATFDLTAVRVYPSQGDVAWAPRTNSEELTRARQYYQKSFSVGTAVAQNAGATGSIGFTAPYAQTTFATASIPIAFSPMRAAPTVTFYSPSAASANCYDSTAVADAGAASAVNIGTNSMTATCILATGGILGDMLNMHYVLDARL